MDLSQPKIGILSAHTEREKKLENKRLIDEITGLGGDAAIVNYRRCAVGVLETGRGLFQYDDDDVPVLVEVDAVIPRVGKFVESGVWVLQLLTSQGVYTTAGPEAVATAKSKMSTHIALDAHGVPTLYGIMPTGIKPRDPTGTFKLLEPDPTRKLIVKTDRGSHGEGVLPPTPGAERSPTRRPTAPTTSATSCKSSRRPLIPRSLPPTCASSSSRTGSSAR